jgi:hypothetical protein
MLTEQEASGEAAIAWGAADRRRGGRGMPRGRVGRAHQRIVRLRRETGTAGSGPPRPLDGGPTDRASAKALRWWCWNPPARARPRGTAYARLALHDGFGVPAPVHGWPTDPDAVVRGLAPLVADVDAVVAAASGSPVLDAFEAAALGAVFGARRVPVTAPRGATGDFGAAGALAVAMAALAIHHGVLPPTLGCRLPARRDLDGRGLGTPTRARPWSTDCPGGMCRPLRLEAADARGPEPLSAASMPRPSCSWTASSRSVMQRAFLKHVARPIRAWRRTARCPRPSCWKRLRRRVARR